MDETQTNEQASNDAPPRGDRPPVAPVRRRDAKFRAELLKKLPQLPYASWSAKDEFAAGRDWEGIVSLRSDAILQPLEPLAPPDPD
jgi:hypothetical protein